ncbi:hypothetical protein L596_002065 [Steinernema carpocapsae]|uniref:Uncharacterized protein n=1 Tax=Steinernema carpocapsae TaxID=34508 RepID=A0A4V6I7L4_STECR|nr:hypothetical protein L596_002065 [Steinernema carpocapsae]
MVFDCKKDGYGREVSAREWEELIYRSRQRINWYVMDSFQNPDKYGSLETRREFVRTLGERIDEISNLEKLLTYTHNINLDIEKMHIVPAQKPNTRQVMGKLLPKSMYNMK